MIQIPDHPEIRCAERTGYPSWMHDDGLRRCNCCGGFFAYDEGESDGWGFICYECLEERKDEDDDA